LERDHTLLYGSRIAGSLATHEVVALAKRHIDAAQQRLGTFAIQATAMFLHALTSWHSHLLCDRRAIMIAMRELT